MNEQPKLNRWDLLQAAKDGDQSAVEACLSSGLNVNFRDESGRSALLKAVIAGHKEIVRTLLEAGSQVNVMDEDQNTPIHAAVDQGDFDLVKLLADAGAELENPDYPWQPIERAAESGNRALFEYLKPFASASLLTQAENLLAHASRPPGKGKEKQALLQAAESGDVGTVDLLLRRGVPANCRDKGGCTPLILASVNDKGDVEPNPHVEIANLLILAGADVEAKSRQNVFPLAGIKSYAMAKLLLDAGANPARMEKYNLCPVGSCWSPLALKLLLERGGEAVRPQMRLQLDFALRTWKVDHLRVLFDFGYRVEPESQERIMFGLLMKPGVTPEIFQAFVDGGMDLNCRTDSGETLLMKAGSQGPAFWTFLIDRGADPHATDKHRKTALHHAVWSNKPDMVQFLIQHGCDPNARSRDGERPIDCIPLFSDRKVQLRQALGAAQE